MSVLLPLLGLWALLGLSEGTPAPFRPPGPPRPHHGCFGDVAAMQTSGVACVAGRLGSCGILASETFAGMDLPALRRYRPLIAEVGRRRCLDPALMAALISRETHAGAALRDGWDLPARRFGLMQLEKIYQPVGSWDGEEHLTQAAGILGDKIREIQRRFPLWTPTQHLKGGLQAYRAGTDAVGSPEDADGDYPNDVLARARFYRRHGF